MQSFPSKQLSVKSKSVTVRSKAIRPWQVSTKSKTVQLKSKTVSHSKKLVQFLQNLSPLNSTLGLLPLDVMPIITLILWPIPPILFPSLIQIKLSHYQNPCKNLLTKVLLWANYHSAEDGIVLPVSGYVKISQSLISILVTIKQLSIVIVPVLFSSTTSTNSNSTSTIYQTYRFW